MKINYERWRQQPTTAGRNSLKLTLYLNRIEMSKHKDLETFLEQSKGLVHKCISKTGLKYWVRLSLSALTSMAECHVSQPCPLLAVVAWWRTATFKPRSLVLKQQYTANIATLQLAGSQNCVRDTLTTYTRLFIFTSKINHRQKVTLI